LFWEKVSITFHLRNTCGASRHANSKIGIRFRGEHEIQEAHERATFRS
jgi:hypothetical protein